MKANSATFERHSIATLSQRLRGLVSRNTVEGWLMTGQLKAEMNPSPKNPHPGKRLGERFWLFRSDYLDQVEKALEQKHEERVRRQLGDSAGAKIIRESAKRQALEILNSNLRRPRGSKKMLPERNPSLCDDDAVGATRMIDKRPCLRIMSDFKK